MARQIRIQYPGATYHVMGRGNQGRAIYANDEDRRLWLKTLTEACEKSGWRIHAYVMMANHFHLLLETPEGNLVSGMKWLQSTYTQRYNGRHQILGHLFQGRYKALVVDGQAGNYLGTVSTYIHLNPARAHLIRIGQESLRQYRWSSYPFYLARPSQKPAWLVTERVLGNLGLRPGDRAGYEAYLEGRVLEWGEIGGREQLNAQWHRIRRGWYLGGDGFRGRLMKYVGLTLEAGRWGTYGGEAKMAHGEAEAERLLAQGMEALGIREEDLNLGSKGMTEKKVLAWWLCQRTTVARRWVSERLVMGDESRVTQAIRHVKGGDGAALRVQLEKVTEDQEDKPIQPLNSVFRA
jgi:putative transposase